MSDAEIVRAGLGPWSDEWVAEHAATGAHAYEVQQQRAALDRLESQNQALQEENDRLGSMLSAANDAEVALQERLSEAEEIVGKRALAVMKYGEPKALQERIDKTRRYVTENGAVMMNTPATWHGFVDEILQLLSPTQETDPE